MFKILFKYKWYIVLIIGLMIAEPSLNSIMNFWLQKIFNAAVPDANLIAIVKALTSGFLLWMLKRIVIFSSSIIKNRFICNAKQDLKHNIFRRLIKLDTSNISQTTSSGEYISVFTNDITLLEQRYLDQIISLLSGIFSLVILGTSFIVLNVKLAVAIIAFGVVSTVVPFIFSKKLNAANMRYSDNISKFTQKLKEYFVAYPTIKNYSIEDNIMGHFDAINRKTEDSKFDSDATISLANNVGSLMSWFMQFIGVGLGIVLVVRGEILIGTVIAAQSFASDLASPLQNIIFNVNSIRSIKAIVNKLETLAADQVAQKSETQTSDNQTPDNQSNEQSADTQAPVALLPDGGAAELAAADAQSADGQLPVLTGGAPYAVRFDDLSLHLGGNSIIEHFSFDFEKGKKYLVVGLNGSGKSSLFKALKKWYNNCDGAIYVDGTEVTDLSSEELSRQVSYLNENVSLFSGTIRENIALFRDYEEESFNRAISSAHIEMDLDREIADEGRNISSGEQRKIEIARSLLLDSVQVLIFDEVVSTLDIETAYEIEKLALSFKDKTIIFISHNFSGKLIAEYDEILVMEGGRLLAHGNYKQLLSECDYFRRICEIKFGSIKTD